MKSLVKGVHLRHTIAAAAVLILSAPIADAQTLIANYPLTVNSADLTANYGAITYGTSATPAPSACGDGSSTGDIMTPPLGSLFNKTNFAVQIHFSLNSYPTSTPQPIFMIDRASRTIGVSVTSGGNIGYNFNNSYYTNSGVPIALNQVDTILLKYVAPDVELFLNGRLIQSATLASLSWSPGANALRLGTLNAATGKVLDGCISNLKIWSGGVVLPVELIAFDAMPVAGGGARLHWETAAGDATRSFGVEHSADGLQWTEIGWVPSQMGNGARSYSFVDAAVPAGAVFYRLRAVDAAGEASYSRIAKLQLSGMAESPALAVNPVAGRLQLRNLSGGEARVYDVTGRQVAALRFDADGSADASGLAAGSYVLRLRGDREETMLRFQKL